MEKKPVLVKEVGMEEDYTFYPGSDKQYDDNRRYMTYESIQTGAAGKKAK